MDYTEIEKAVYSGVQQYLSTTQFSWTELPEWHGRDGQNRARIVLEALPQCKTVNILILIYAMMHMHSIKLKNTVAQHLVNTGVLGPATSELMQKNRAITDLQTRRIKVVTELIKSILIKLALPVDIDVYKRILAVFNTPYGRTSRDVLGHLQELADTKFCGFLEAY